jgi:FtsP/CotA-like multicopper oxidase with cupredoxin domain
MFGVLLVLSGAALLPRPASAQEMRRFDLVVKAGTVAPEWRTLRVKQGDAVELRWTSESQVKLHLHGYDLELAVKAGEPGVMTFKATLPGRFALSTVKDGAPASARSHQHGARVLYLEVHP